ncbi:MAG TPA: hypothetical protein VMB52_00380 [Verrucomicrobiae bacterium]|nr:hypothetical protein [Verrucomicrobiae bacterium]
MKQAPKVPEVRIYFSWQLYDNVSVPLLKGTENSSWLETKDKQLEYAANYRSEWSKYSEPILSALVDSLKIRFYRSVIDAPCTPGVIPFSDPLTLNFAYYPNQFVDIMLHELCHIILTDNTVYPIHSSEQRIVISERWIKLFGNEFTRNTLVHIPVHALSKYIYLDVLQEPERLERDVKNLEHLPDYKAAWDYVNTHDYRTIIEQLKNDYKALADELRDGKIQA